MDGVVNVFRARTGAAMVCDNLPSQGPVMNAYVTLISRLEPQGCGRRSPVQCAVCVFAVPDVISGRGGVPSMRFLIVGLPTCEAPHCLSSVVLQSTEKLEGYSLLFLGVRKTVLDCTERNDASLRGSSCNRPSSASSSLPTAPHGSPCLPASQMLLPFGSGPQSDSDLQLDHDTAHTALHCRQG